MPDDVFLHLYYFINIYIIFIYAAWTYIINKLYTANNAHIILLCTPSSAKLVKLTDYIYTCDTLTSTLICDCIDSGIRIINCIRSYAIMNTFYNKQMFYKSTKISMQKRIFFAFQTEINVR